ncbi:MAG: hypothetical protein GF411_03430 [Candidatus Lokiarchaeota archaeon]|nr:hypothetical protein [Candidatus Lokiarchaeota archaeon]
MTEDTANEPLINTAHPNIRDVEDIDQYWSWLEDSQIQEIDSEEIRILQCLMKEYIEDSKKLPLEQAGWRNKYNISKKARVSQKKIYCETGPIESLVDLGLIEIRDSPISWGGQKYNYRIKITKQLIHYLEL